MHTVLSFMRGHAFGFSDAGAVRQMLQAERDRLRNLVTHEEVCCFSSVRCSHGRLQIRSRSTCCKPDSTPPITVSWGPIAGFPTGEALRRRGGVCIAPFLSHVETGLGRQRWTQGPRLRVEGHGDSSRRLGCCHFFRACRDKHCSRSGWAVWWRARHTSPCCIR